jgi:hypothetical protein
MLVFGIWFEDHAVATCQTQVSADGFDVIRLCNSQYAGIILIKKV